MIKNIILNASNFFSGVSTETAYYNLLRTEYELLANEDRKRSEIADNYIKSLIDRCDGGQSPLLTDIYSFELALLVLKPVERLRCEIWNLRNKYREIAGETLYNSYIAAKQCDPATAEEKVLRAEMEHLTGQIHNLYVLKPACDDLREQLLKKVIFMMLMFLTYIVLLIRLITDNGETDTRFLLLLIISSGAIGGFVSMQRRLQNFANENNSYANYLELQHGRWSIYQAPISGAIFAVTLMLIFAANMISGELFPAFCIPDKLADKCTSEIIGICLRKTLPSDEVDFFKIIVWSFIAGFAERFVPDTLDRLVNRKEGGKKVAETVGGSDKGNGGA